MTAWPTEDAPSCSWWVRNELPPEGRTLPSSSTVPTLFKTRLSKLVILSSTVFNSCRVWPRLTSSVKWNRITPPKCTVFQLPGRMCAGVARTWKSGGISTRVMFYITIFVQFKKTSNRRAGSRSKMGFRSKQIAFNETLQKVILKSPRKFTRRIEKKRRSLLCVIERSCGWETSASVWFKASRIIPDSDRLNKLN